MDTESEDEDRYAKILQENLHLFKALMCVLLEDGDTLSRMITYLARRTDRDIWHIGEVFNDNDNSYNYSLIGQILKNYDDEVVVGFFRSIIHEAIEHATGV